MEFLDEEARPRFQFQSRISSGPSPEPEIHKINKPLAIICVSLSLLLSLFTIFFLHSEILSFILLWFSLSLLVGPFAPLSVTGGDIRVGQGEVLETPVLDPTAQIDDQPKKRRTKSRRQDETTVPSPLMGEERVEKVSPKIQKDSIVEEEREWTDGDFDLLKKQISKHPVGTPRRWELIAEAFKGRHGVDNVIKTAKSMPERKPGGGDSFSQFLKQRKPLDKRVEEELTENGSGSGSVNNENSDGQWLSWSSAEDIALLNALKTFPKEVSMRWEKIAVAVPGRSKTSCMKRVAELKKGFRSSKASAE